MRRCFLTLLVLGIVAAPALAQDPGTTHTLTSSDIDSGFLIAPDFKFTDVNGDFANLAGGYGGWVIDKKFLIGGGVYTLTNGSGPDDMTYGGGVFEYFVNQGSLLNVSVRGLVGGGSATLGSSFPGFDDFDDLDLGDIDLGRIRGFDRFRGSDGRLNLDRLRGVGRPFDVDLSFLDRDFATSSSFFVAEPELDVILNISERFRFSVGGGYRFIGGAGRLNDRLDGFTANVALKMSFF